MVDNKKTELLLKVTTANKNPTQCHPCLYSALYTAVQYSKKGDDKKAYKHFLLRKRSENSGSSFVREQQSIWFPQCQHHWARPTSGHVTLDGKSCVCLTDHNTTMAGPHGLVCRSKVSCCTVGRGGVGERVGNRLSVCRQSRSGLSWLLLHVSRTVRLYWGKW